MSILELDVIVTRPLGGLVSSELGASVGSKMAVTISPLLTALSSPYFWLRPLFKGVTQLTV
jgi:hypothetical protein